MEWDPFPSLIVMAYAVWYWYEYGAWILKVVVGLALRMRH